MTYPKRRACIAAVVIAACFVASAAARADMRDIPVPQVVIYAGDQILQASLVEKNFSVPEGALKTYVLERQQIEGKYARRTLLPGKPIALSYVKQRDSVIQGVLTKATFEKNGLVITTYLVPLQSGTAGQLVDARNAEYGTIIKALVKPDGTLQIGGS